MSFIDITNMNKLKKKSMACAAASPVYDLENFQFERRTAAATF